MDGLTMRSRKHTAWKKNRKLGDVYGGRKHPKITDRIFRRLHSLRPPGVGVETPICIEDNPSRDYYFPLSGEECIRALRALPEDHFAGITHLWLRRPSGIDRTRRAPLAEFICGSRVRLIVIYPWHVDRRLSLGRTRPSGKRLRELERSGARIVRHRGSWHAQFDPETVRAYCVHLLYHQVGYHMDWYQRRWSAANFKQTEDAASQYAVRFEHEGMAVLSHLRDQRGGFQG